MKKTIEVSEDLYRQIESALSKQDASQSLDAFVEELLEQALHTQTEGVYAAHDEAKIKERLQSLGYID